jgi:hypothetical protein
LPRKSSLTKSWPGIFLLTLFAAFLGGGIGANWPGFSRLAQFAGADESGAANALRGDVIALQERIAQAEVRLDTIENTAPVVSAQAPPEILPEETITEPLAPEAQAQENDVGAEALMNEGALAFQMNQIGNRLNALETVLPEIGARLEATATRAEQDIVMERLAGLEAVNSGDFLRRAAQVLALSDLSRAAIQSAPFLPQLNALAATAPGDPALGALRVHAAEGVPTLQELSARFPEMAREALDAESVAADTGFFARMWNNVRHLISIRRIGNVDGTDSASILARAEIALKDGNLAGAVGEVNALSGAAAHTVTPWLAGAEARLELDDAIASLNARVVAALAAPAPSPVAPPPSLSPALPPGANGAPAAP